MATPVLLLVLIYLIYAIIAFRQPQGGALEGPAVRGHAEPADALDRRHLHARAQSRRLRHRAPGERLRRGLGQRPETADGAEGEKLPVQVIAQQWAFTYRYPTYGGVETTHLELPVNKMIELHVTSLDVIHSFWAYQLGVKADANPGVDNVAFVKPTKIQTFEVHCAELCGIWHGSMFDHGHVVTQSSFESWIAEQQKTIRGDHQGAAEVQHHLPPRTAGARRMSTTTSSATPPAVSRPLWRRLLGFNLLTAVILGVGGYYLGWFIGHLVTEGKSFEYTAATDENDVALLLAYFFGVIGFLIGLGFANYPISRLLGRPASLREKEDEGIGRYFGLCTDHKVVGIQYLVRNRRVLLHRRAERDADPHRAAAQPAHLRGAQPVPLAGGHARHDDDGDDDLGDPGAVRQLLRADHDRRAADGLPADRGADLLAADGRRLHPHLDDLLRRLPDRLDRLRAAQRPGRDGDGLLHLLLRAGRHLDVRCSAST